MAPGIFSATRSVHMIVRQLFIRLVFSLQFESSLSMEIISFWMWLEGIGHADFLASIDALDNHDLRSIALAAKMLIETLRRNSGHQPNHRSVQGGYFCIEALKGIVLYLNNVCCKVLEDILQVATAKERICHRAHQAQPQQNVMARAPMSTRDLLSRIKASYISARSHEAEGSSSRSIMPSPPKTHTLKDIENPIEQCLSSYPLATLFKSLTITEEEEEEPAADIQIQQPPSVPRDERTLFVTFSNGYPFTADELYEFFTRNFGDDVEVISVQEPVAPKPPLYAHITFYNQETLFHILAGRPRVKFVIRGKHLWARKFVPKRKKAQNF
ncbi:uncharacterized protein LOC101768212 [Setaria italica]|uniref:uncharacterized protein LOC101768212 n=1 Tax=Setaria italica TaxID=4555 RepID=UPI000350E8AA|nr:uncharacterized protein LOC101768212 [Setaria italica]